ncbi:hypothetical protein N7476_004189 [Penicillium atrosanguineum]|uniref:PHD-type domain-containing protein n=1 Tax=Penicillium atrosanguineum TaxID=1132637 RepID=A0A9W9U5P1_9EURO|nr:hypothetical protein N7476_004189 [Penicillium atrosanguineum]
MEATNNLSGEKKPEVASDEPISEDQAVVAAATRISRTGRVLKAPTAFIPAPAAAGSGGKRRRGGKKAASINCAECGRGNSPGNNPIVLCDGCESAWHKHCHNPQIPDAAIENLDTEWKCNNCEPSQRRIVKAKPMKGKLFRAKLAKAQNFAKPHSMQASTQIEVANNEFTDAEKRVWLSSLSHSLLVEMLVDISSKNPSLPIFPANMKDLPTSKFAIPSARPLSAQSAPPSGKHAHDEAAAIDSHPAKGSRTISNTAVPVASLYSTLSPSQRWSSSDTADEGIFLAKTSDGHFMQVPEHSATPALSPDAPSPYEAELLTDSEGGDIPFDDHRIYPKPGNGFALPWDPADLDILREDPEAKTFSHALHSSIAKRIAGN